MALCDSFDYWSPIAALGALTLVAILVFLRPVIPIALTLMLGVAIFVAGIPVASREKIPSYNRLLGVYCGAFGLVTFAIEGWGLRSAALILVGAISVIELAYEHVTGHPPEIV